MKKIVFIVLLVNIYCVGQLQAQLFGGQLKATTSPYPPGTVHCKPQNRTAVVEVTSPVTGKKWMDRNLGAERVATSSTDALSYGDLYQWGRGADGHQCRLSGTRNGPSSLNQPGHGDFLVIQTSSVSDDWRSDQNNALWQGLGGINNPCPQGFRIPTKQEFINENINSGVEAFNSVLKLPYAGWRDQLGVISAESLAGSTLVPYGFAWTSTVSGGSSTNDAEAFAYYSTRAFENPYARARGYSVRCIKN
ncbi:MAG: hypothetical protein RL403_37 [Bacteroidota bacterium]|jgi:uncharacterized protein (TIGR02145 family)